MSYNESRPRLSIDIPFKLFDDLNKLLGDLRVKSKIYEKITEELVEVMNRMTVRQRLIFISVLLEDNLNITEKLSSFKKAKEFSEKAMR